MTVLVDTARHAALAKGAAQPAGNGQKLSPGFILASDFAVTFVAVTAVVFIAAAVAASRRARRVTRQADGAPAARRGRRAAARGGRRLMATTARKTGSGTAPPPEPDTSQTGTADGRTRPHRAVPGRHLDRA